MAGERVRAHLIAGGFPAGQTAGHDHDYARLQILGKLQEREQVHTTVTNDYDDIEKWLPDCKLLVTYVAGPVAQAEQHEVLRQWVEAGGRWLALHGSSGGKAARMPDSTQRQMVQMDYHDTLGGFFIHHPPIRKFKVELADRQHPLTKGLPDVFETIDEPYMVKMLAPESTQVLLTADWGMVPPTENGFYYAEDDAVLPGTSTRVIAFERTLSQGAVAYTTLGHCHTPQTNSQRSVDESVAEDHVVPLHLRGSWETEGFRTLLANGVSWGLGEI